MQCDHFFVRLPNNDTVIRCGFTFLIFGSNHGVVAFFRTTIEQNSCGVVLAFLLFLAINFGAFWICTSASLRREYSEVMCMCASPGVSFTQ